MPNHTLQHWRMNNGTLDSQSISDLSCGVSDIGAVSTSIEAMGAIVWRCGPRTHKWLMWFRCFAVACSSTDRLCFAYESFKLNWHQALEGNKQNREKKNCEKIDSCAGMHNFTFFFLFTKTLFPYETGGATLLLLTFYIIICHVYDTRHAQKLELCQCVFFFVSNYIQIPFVIVSNIVRFWFLATSGVQRTATKW